MYFMEIVSLSIEVLKGSKDRLREAVLSRRIKKLRERIWKASVPDVMPGSAQTQSKAGAYAKMFRQSARDFDQILDDARGLEEEGDAQDIGVHGGMASRQALSLVLEIASTRRWLNRMMSSMFAGDSGSGGGGGGGGGTGRNVHTGNGHATSGAVHAGALADACVRVWDRCHANGGAILHSAEDLRHELRALDHLTGSRSETGVGARLLSGSSATSENTLPVAGDKIVKIVRECLQLKHAKGRV